MKAWRQKKKVYSPRTQNITQTIPANDMSLKAHQNETRLNAGLLEGERYYIEQSTNLPKVRQIMIISSIPLKLLTYPYENVTIKSY